MFPYCVQTVEIILREDDKEGACNIHSNTTSLLNYIIV